VGPGKYGCICKHKYISAGEKRRRTFGGASFDNSANIVRDKVRRISLDGKGAPTHGASTPFRPRQNQKENLARASLGSGISDIAASERNVTVESSQCSDSSFIINTIRDVTK